MTTFAVPPAGSPAWREIYPTPPDVKLDLGAGRWCPLDDTTLQIRLDGFGCPTCRAAWDFQGLSGRWLAEVQTAKVAPSVHWRPSALLGLAGLAGSAIAAVGLVALLSALEERLVLLFAAVLAAAAAAIVLQPVISRARERALKRTWAWADYRHNTVRALDVDGEVRDEH